MEATKEKSWLEAKQINLSDEDWQAEPGTSTHQQLDLEPETRRTEQLELQAEQSKIESAVPQPEIQVEQPESEKHKKANDEVQVGLLDQSILDILDE